VNFVCGHARLAAVGATGFDPSGAPVLKLTGAKHENGKTTDRVWTT